jgi:cytoskeletal protein CcmA (bactofilin family)
VAHIVVNGTVAGPIRATEYVELLPKARVTGDVCYKSIEIHVGAIVMGQLVYENPQRSDKIVEFKPAAGKSD